MLVTGISVILYSAALNLPDISPYYRKKKLGKQDNRLRKQNEASNAKKIKSQECALKQINKGSNQKKIKERT